MQTLKSKSEVSELDLAKTDPTLTRRKFLGWGIYAMAAGITTVIAVPVAGYYLIPAFATSGSRLQVPVGKLNELANQMELKEVVLDNLSYKDGFKQVTLSKKVYVKALKPNAQRPDDFLVLDVTCTHLGCATFYNPPNAPVIARDKIYCFCHGSIFDQTGGVVRGPAARALGQYKVSIENAQVTIDAFQTFSATS